MLARSSRFDAEANDKPIEIPSVVWQEDEKLARNEIALFESRASELESSIAILKQQETQTKQELAEQDAQLEGKRGGRMWAVSTVNGETTHECELKSPPVWDGMAVAQGRLYTATMDGKVVCYGVSK